VLLTLPSLHILPTLACMREGFQVRPGDVVAAYVGIERQKRLVKRTPPLTLPAHIDYNKRLT